MAFPEDWIQTLIQKNDIVSVISEYAQLTPKGGKLWACCPFHHEKTPSFKVDAQRQQYHCFGCHAGGTVIRFVMDMERLSYTEAIQFLARRAGMDMPEMRDNEQLRREKAFNDRLRAACREAAVFYHEKLKAGGDALRYLERRGVTYGVARRFGLGFAPEDWDALNTHLTSAGFSRDELVAAGLVRLRSNGNGAYDFFKNRVMFPIISEHGEVIGFGGRTMGNDEPKYLNTGETALFNKRYRLYGLNLCDKKSLSDLIVVEGYMDVVSLHSAGITNAVASLGTALTAAQARLIKRYTSNVYISYDGDSAGQNATLRGLDILAGEGLNVRVISIPDKADPDDYVRKYGKDGFLRLKDTGLALNEFKLEHLASLHDLTNADSRQEFAIKACDIVSKLQPVEQERYYEYVSRKCGITVETLREQGAKMANIGTLGDNRGGLRHNMVDGARAVNSTGEPDKAEMMLVACAANDAESAAYIAENGVEFMQNDILRRFVAELAASEGIRSCSSILANHDEDGSAATIIQALNLFASESIVNVMTTTRECIASLKRRHIKAKLMELSFELDSHMIEKGEYAARYAELSRQMNEVR